MNLVQIQERLKDAPVQAIMQYANGGNPMVPPYLALAELKRRESINQSAQSQQAMQQGQAPSVKEQVERAAGLAALQQQMQQQGMQNLMAQARPQGIPENVPQPRRQPESEGISGLPAGDFNFADGGIVAFAGPQGSYVGDKDAAEEQRRADQERARQLARSTGMSFEEAFAAIKDIATLPGRGILGALETGISRPLRAAGLDIPYLPKETYGGDAASLTPYMDALRRQRQQAIEGGYAAKEAARAAAVKTPEGAEMVRGKPAPVSAEPPKFELVGDYESAMRDVMAIRDPAERLAAMEALQRTQRTGPAQQQTAAPAAPGAAPALGIAALPGSDEAMQMTLGQMRAKRSLEDIAAEQEKAKGIFGLTQPFGEERMKRAQAMEAARQQELESRGMERLMRVLGGIGARGLGGAGTAYLQSVEAERAADAAFRKQMDELMGGVEEKRRAEAVSGMTDAQKRIAEERKSAQEAAGKIVDADTKFKLQELQQKAVRERLSPEEEYIRSELLKGGKYLEIIENLARAKGAIRTEAEAQKAQLRREAEWNEISGDYVRRQEMAKLGVRTLEDYLRYVQRSSGGAGESSTVASGIPPIPAGAVRLKGAQ